MESTMILETISKNASSLMTLKLGEGKSCRSTYFSSSSYSSDMEPIINVLLRSNSLSLRTLELIECKSVQRLTVGVSLEWLWVYDCPNLMSIKLDEGAAGLKSLSIRRCSSSLLDMISAEIQSSPLERLKLGPFLGNIDEFPWPFSSSLNSFPNLDSLEFKLTHMKQFNNLQIQLIILNCYSPNYIFIFPPATKYISRMIPVLQGKLGEAIVADLASGLLGKLVSLAAEEVVQAWNFHEDLNTLHQRLESVGALLYDAHTKNLIMSTAKNWFDKLEAVAYVANVFMDELAYEVTRRKAENRHKALDFFIPSKNTLLYRLKVARKIKSIQSSFNEIFKLAVDLGLQPVAYLGSTVQDRDIRTTHSYEDKSNIVGRDKDVSYLVQTVCKKHEEDLQVFVVAGMGGQGKTTLARMVFNSNDTIHNFSKRMWVTVSDDFDYIKILNEMIESLTSTNLGLKNPQGLTNELQKSL
ncbi:hypothetical protein ACET3Z_026228 [Daucus carota]